MAIKKEYQFLIDPVLDILKKENLFDEIFEPKTEIEEIKNSSSFSKDEDVYNYKINLFNKKGKQVGVATIQKKIYKDEDGFSYKRTIMGVIKNLETNRSLKIDEISVQIQTNVRESRFHDEFINIIEDVIVNENILLEKGDRIKVITEKSFLNENFSKEIFTEEIIDLITTSGSRGISLKKIWPHGVDSVTVGEAFSEISDYLINNFVKLPILQEAVKYFLRTNVEWWRVANVVNELLETGMSPFTSRDKF